MDRPTKGEIALVHLLDGKCSVSDIEYISGWGDGRNQEVLTVVSELVKKYPDIYYLDIEDGI